MPDLSRRHAVTTAAEKPALAVVRSNDDAKTLQSYSDLESNIRDLERMAILAAHHVEQEGQWYDPKEYREMLHFLVFDVEHRCGALRKKFYAVQDPAVRS